MNKPLWTPSQEQVERANVTEFRRVVAKQYEVELADYDALYEWSIDQTEQFWSSLWDYAGVIGEKGERVLTNGDKMPGAQWFPDAEINFAENLLKRRDDGRAIVFWGENKVKYSFTYQELYQRVSTLAQALRAEGVEKGDRVVGFMPNMPETVMAMLATTSIGAVWSSCSPDFGVNGVLDRFGQVEPKVLFTANGYFYNGKTHDSLARISEITSQMPTLKRVVVVPYTEASPNLPDSLEKGCLLGDFTGNYEPTEIDFERVSFSDPLYIMFSSGTTGVPKCIVHSVGGTLLQHLKEHMLHVDVKRDENVFYFTTCGWMMWNWLVTALAAEATLMLYDGSPFYPGARILFDYAESEQMNVFGTSAKYIDAVAKSSLKPAESHDLSQVRTMLSTGSPLAPESFDFVYRDVKSDICLSSISGGTDIVSCFALGNPVLPVWRGELQSRGLGMKVEVYSDDGEPLEQEKGELVCTKPFPCMPIGFWNDASGEKYHAAYFDVFDNVWCHGDYVELTENKGIVIYGRSDAVLNPGGVRIGTAEIYRQVEQLYEVIESLVVGQDWRNDVRVVLFVRLRDGVDLDDALIDRIKTQIRQNTTPRHVPAKVIAVADIPRTKSGKIVELAVRNVIHNRAVKNMDALANPEALDLYKDLPALS